MSTTEPDPILERALEIEAEDALESTTTYRVLKRDEDTVRKIARWDECTPLDITARYPYPTARVVGEAYGEGDYILFPTTAYGAVTLLTVVADKVYREAAPKEEA